MSFLWPDVQLSLPPYVHNMLKYHFGASALCRHHHHSHHQRHHYHHKLGRHRVDHSKHHVRDSLYNTMFVRRASAPDAEHRDTT